jgi:hypothetical protein
LAGLVCELVHSGPRTAGPSEMVASGVLRGDMPLSHWDSVQDGFLLDVLRERATPGETR